MLDHTHPNLLNEQLVGLISGTKFCTEFAPVNIFAVPNSPRGGNQDMVQGKQSLRDGRPLSRYIITNGNVN